MIQKITEQTLVPLGLVVSVVLVADYIISTSIQSSQNAHAIERLEKRQESVESFKTDIEVIKSKLSRIEKILDK